ncbi:MULTISPECIES: hypothetical protein [unclassified Roseovarius]|uniref:hypothetical protein n=1 Tax=unclassified Roseovarius TaxID=2614913 RepID=UPI00125FCA6F|nr:MULTISPECIES: hypothetical protein [unclassified Roseovarius]
MMLKSCWIISVVIGLVAISAIGWGIYGTGLTLGEVKAKNTYHTSRYAIDAVDQIDRLCLKGDPANISECVVEVVKATNENQRAQDDLEAQTKMAQWAFFSVLSSCFGLILLGFTLRYTKKAADAAAELYELESQPFLSLEVIDGANFRIIDGKAGFVRDDEFKEGPLFCKIINGGRSSAIATRIHREWSFCEKGSPPAITIGDPDDRKNPVDNSKRDFLTSIPVGAQSSSPPITTFNDQTSICLEPKNAYFHGFVEFSDASGRRRGRTGFCFVFLPSISSRGMSVGFPEDTKGHWYYNKIDD